MMIGRLDQKLTAVLFVATAIGLSGAELSRSASGQSAPKKPAPAANAPPAGSAMPAKTPATVPAAAAPGAKSKPVEPFSLTYVPRDAVLVAAIRPPALLKCEALAAINERLMNLLNAKEPLGFSPERIAQITIVARLQEAWAGNTMKLPDGSSAVMMDSNSRTIEPAPVAAILRMAGVDDVPELIKALQSDSEERTYAGRTYRHATNEQGVETCVLVDGRTVVVSVEEAYLRRMIVAGSNGASKARWTQPWSDEAQADALVLVHVAALRNALATLASQAGVNAGDITAKPAAAAPLFDVSTALVAFSVHDRISARLQLAAKISADVPRIREAVQAVTGICQTGLSTLRQAAAEDAGDNGLAMLAAIDAVDGALDSVEIENSDGPIKASATISLDQAAKMVEGWVASLARDANAPGQPMIGAESDDDPIVGERMPAEEGEPVPDLVPAAEAVPGAEVVPAAAAAPADQAAEDKPVEPLSLAWVPRDAAMVAAIRPQALLKFPAMGVFHERVLKLFDGEQKLGLLPEKIEQITIVAMLADGPLVNGPASGNLTLPDGTPLVIRTGGQAVHPQPVAVILRLPGADDAARVTNAVRNSKTAEARQYAGQTYFKRSGENGSCVFVDDRTVVLCDTDETMRRVIVAGREGAANSRWAYRWNERAGGDVVALANLASMRSLIALTSKEPPTVTPESAAPLFDAGTAVVALRFGDQIDVTLDLSTLNPADVERIGYALRAFLTMNQAGLSLLRKSAAGDGSEKGAARLAMVDVVDSVLDTVVIYLRQNERCVEANATIRLDHAAKLAQGWIAAQAENDQRPRKK